MGSESCGRMWNIYNCSGKRTNVIFVGFNLAAIGSSFKNLIYAWFEKPSLLQCSKGSLGFTRRDILCGDFGTPQRESIVGDLAVLRNLSQKLTTS